MVWIIDERDGGFDGIDHLRFVIYAGLRRMEKGEEIDRKKTCRELK